MNYSGTTGHHFNGEIQHAWLSALLSRQSIFDERAQGDDHQNGIKIALEKTRREIRRGCPYKNLKECRFVKDSIAREEKAQSLMRWVVFGLLLAISSFAQGTPAGQSGSAHLRNWTHVASREGGFFVDMPGIAKDYNRQIKFGSTVEILRGFRYENGSENALVSYEDTSEPVTSFQPLRDALAAKAPILWEKDLRIGGYRGKALRSTNDDGVPFDQIVVAAGLRFYVLQFSSSNSIDRDLDESKFFSSFGFYDATQTCSLTVRADGQVDGGRCVQTKIKPTVFK
jgi:hypothetical protein